MRDISVYDNDLETISNLIDQYRLQLSKEHEMFASRIYKRRRDLTCAAHNDLNVTKKAVVRSYIITTTVILYITP